MIDIILLIELVFWSFMATMFFVLKVFSYLCHEYLSILYTWLNLDEFV